MNQVNPIAGRSPWPSSPSHGIPKQPSSQTLSSSLNLWLIVLFVLIVAMPARLSFPLGPFKTFTILDIALWILAPCLFLFSRSQHFNVGPWPLFVALCTSPLIAGISLLWSEFPLSTVKMFIYSVTAVLGYLVPLNLFRRCSSRFIGTCMGLFVVVSVSLAILYWLRVPFVWNVLPGSLEDLAVLDPYTYALVFARLDNVYLGRSNDFAAILALYVIFFAGLAKVTSDKRYGVAFAISALGLLLTFSRGVIISTIAVLAVALLIRPTLRNVVGTGLIAGVLIIPVFFFLEEVKRSGLDIIGLHVMNPDNIFSRLDRISLALDLIGGSPFIGHGGGGFIDQSYGINSTFHNTFLEQWVAYGVAFGSLVIVSLLSLPISFFRWTRRPLTTRAIARFIGFAIIAFLLVCTNQTANEAVIPSLMFRIFLGFAVAYLGAFHTEQAGMQQGVRYSWNRDYKL